VKAGSNITKLGEVTAEGDYIEEALFSEYKDANRILLEGDIVLASTGDGTLGKCGVFRLRDNSGQTLPAIADGHVTVIRVKPDEVYPEYLCDYLRKGFGSAQIQRLFTGSTGLIEITPEDIDQIVCPNFPDLPTQQILSGSLRSGEKAFEETLSGAAAQLEKVESDFFNAAMTKQSAPGK
jgi:type I restriction enzyme M protein